MVSRNKSPLMIVVDNGSSKEDYEGLKRLKTFGFKIIVIDHHPVYDKIDDVADVHINPHLVEKDPVIGAGALCSHIAMAADKDNQEYFDFISCVSSISDHMQGPLFDDSFNRIKDKFSNSDLRGFGEAVDYELQRSGFLDPWTFIKEILTAELGLRSKLRPEYQKTIISKQKESLDTSLKYCKSKESKGRIIITIDLFNTNHKMAYPKSGRAIGLLHAHFEKKNKGKECISFGFNNEMITVRATDNSTMDVNVLIGELKEKFPFAKVDGGGHAHAGSIRFINAAKDEIIKYVEDKY
jgi:RecJ-like exonuclease